MKTIVTVFLMVLGMLGPVSTSGQQTERPASVTSAAGAVLVDRLRQGGAVMFIRHADTAGQS